MSNTHTVGWIGTGRMGFALSRRLLESGCDVSVYNRTRAKAEPLAALGAKIVDSPAELADRDIVFTMVAGPEDVLEVTLGDSGVLSRSDAAPKIIIDSTTIDPDASATLRRGAAERDTAVLAAPAGLDRTALHKQFAGHRKAVEFDQCLTMLDAQGLITHSVEKTRGSSRHVYRAVRRTAA